MVILKSRSICSVRLLEDGLSKTPPNKHKGWTNVGLTLGQRRRRWANVSPAVGQRLVFAGHNITHTPATYVIMLIGEMTGGLIHSHYRCEEHRKHTYAYILLGMFHCVGDLNNFLNVCLITDPSAISREMAVWHVWCCHIVTVYDNTSHQVV